MMQRVCRYPPRHARLIRLEDGPPMYRMLGYVDRTNVHWDLASSRDGGCLDETYKGPFSEPWPPAMQNLPVGPGRFGLPTHPLAFTSVYWDERGAQSQSRLPYLRMDPSRPPPPARPEAEVFPEMAVPGCGMLSKFRDSGYVVHPGII